MEVYEQVGAGDDGEELYDDVSAVPFNGQPSPQPNSSYPNHHSHTATYPPKGPQPPAVSPYKGGKGPPPIPTRAPSTSLTSGSAKTLPARTALQKKQPELKKPDVKKGNKKPEKKPAPVGGGGGIDMGEILKKARNRNSQVFEDLEKKTQGDDNDDDKHAAPWLKQLRKTPRSNLPDGKDDDEVPEFLRRSRAKTGSISSVENDSSSPEVRAGPPVATKPRSATVLDGSAADGAEKPHFPPTRPKPAPRIPTDKAPATSKPPAVASKPPAVANKPPPVSNKPPPVSNKPPPVASKPPATSPKPQPSIPNHAPTQPGSVKALAANLFPQQAPGMPPKPAESRTRNETSDHHLPPKPPVSSPPPSSLISPPSSQPPPPFAPPPPPQDSPPVSHLPFQSHPPSQPPPPPQPSLPFLPPAPSQPPPRFQPPPPSQTPAPFQSPPHFQPSAPSQAPLPSQPPAPSQPPPVSRLPPSSSQGQQPLPSFSKSPHQAPFQEKPPPALPDRPPPSTYKPPPFQATHAEPTPTTTVLKYRRLPLPAVDLFNPPPLPPQSTKPKPPIQLSLKPRPPLIPTESMVMEDDDIYDDTCTAIEPEEDQEIYDDVMGEAPPSPPRTLPPTLRTPSTSEPVLPPKPYSEPPVPQPPSISSLPPKSTSGQPPPSFAAPPPPPVPQEEEQEDYEDLANVQSQFQGSGDGSQSVSGEIPEQEVYEDFQEPPLPTPTSSFPPTSQPATSAPPPVSATTLSLPPPPMGGGSNSSSPSPTFNRKGLSKKQQKEEEKKQKELKKMEQQKEKERKKRDELRAKNRAKSLKNLKQFQLPSEILPLFTVEVLEDRTKGGKDHLAVIKGERLSVILLTHANLDPNKYLAEKDDGMIGLVDKAATMRTVYQSTQELGVQPPAPAEVDDFGYGMGEDLYESVGIDDMEGGMGQPPLPSMNSPRRPPPSQAPPGIPEDSQELYECLPDEN